MIVESVVSSGSGSKFVSLLSFELVSRGIMRSLLEGRIHCVAEVFKKVEKLGVAPLKLFDGNSFHFLKKECEKMVECGEVEKFVDLIDTLAGNTIICQWNLLIVAVFFFFFLIMPLRNNFFSGFGDFGF